MKYTRHVCRILLAMAAVVVLSHQYDFSYVGWALLATIFVMLTSKGSAVYQGIVRYILLLMFVALISWCCLEKTMMHQRLVSVTLGAIMGVLFNTLVLKDKIDVDYRQAMVTLLIAYKAYFQAIMRLILKKPVGDIGTAKQQVEQALQTLPYWVFERGFDLSLQKGYRHFLLKMTEIGELLFAMHHLARFSYSSELRRAAMKSMQCILSKADDFWIGLINTLQLSNHPIQFEPFYQEIDAIEKKIKKMIPLTLEGMSLSKEYVYWIEWMYNLKELQDLLIRLVEALPQPE